MWSITCCISGRPTVPFLTISQDHNFKFIAMSQSCPKALKSWNIATKIVNLMRYVAGRTHPQPSKSPKLFTPNPRNDQPQPSQSVMPSVTNSQLNPLISRANPKNLPSTQPSHTGPANPLGTIPRRPNSAKLVKQANQTNLHHQTTRSALPSSHRSRSSPRHRTCVPHPCQWRGRGVVT